MRTKERIIEEYVQEGRDFEPLMLEILCNIRDILNDIAGIDTDKVGGTD